MTLLILTTRYKDDLDFTLIEDVHSIVMIMIGLDSDDWLDVIEYTFFSGCGDLDIPVT